MKWFIILPFLFQDYSRSMYLRKEIPVWQLYFLLNIYKPLDWINDIFAVNAWYFRNAFVPAYYKKRNSWDHWISRVVFEKSFTWWTQFPSKPDINGIFTPKTKNQIFALRKKFTSQSIFGRLDIMYALDIKPSRASELLKEMREKKIIESVSGFSKGKYRFKSW